MSALAEELYTEDATPHTSERPMLLSAEALEASNIPADTFQFNYNEYVEKYEASRKDERAMELAAIHAMSKELAKSNSHEEYQERLRTFHEYADPINARWGNEFDNDIINLVQTLLISHKDMTFVIKPGTHLYWYDRLSAEIKGLPYDQDSHYWDNDDEVEVQAHPGRPDKERINLRVYELADSASKMSSFALKQTTHLAA